MTPPTAARSLGAAVPRDAARARGARTPTLALSVEQACLALGVSWDLWREHIEPEIKLVRIGRRKLIAVRELERWLDEHAETALESR
jgi:hypothetical protein